MMHVPARTVSWYMAGQFFLSLEKSGMAERAAVVYGPHIIKSASI